MYYRHLDHSFWLAPPPDAYTQIDAAAMPGIEAALALGRLPRLENGEWKIYTQDDPPADVLLHQIRHQRDQLLRETDWTQLADAPLSEPERLAYRAHRQRLRDLPQQFPDGKGVVWPTMAPFKPNLKNITERLIDEKR